jgi:hypothetical protein
VREVGPVVPELNPGHKLERHSDIKLPEGKHQFNESPKLRYRNGPCFFSQPDLQVPKEKVSQHAREHVMVPTREFPPCRVPGSDLHNPLKHL